MNDVEVVKCSPATNMIAVAWTETSSTIVQDCCLKGSKKNLRYLTEVTSLKKWLYVIIYININSFAICKNIYSIQNHIEMFLWTR